MAQSWIHLARDIAPQVPELPAVIEQEVATLTNQELTEELLTQMAKSITRRVEEAGHQEVAASLLRRMGRAIYELLLLLATEEELRAMGMLVQAAQAAPPSVAGWTAPPPPSTPLSPAQDRVPAQDPAPLKPQPPPSSSATSPRPSPEPGHPATAAPPQRPRTDPAGAGSAQAPDTAMPDGGGAAGPSKGEVKSVQPGERDKSAVDAGPAGDATGAARSTAAPTPRPLGSDSGRAPNSTSTTPPPPLAGRGASPAGPASSAVTSRTPETLDQKPAEPIASPAGTPTQAAAPVGQAPEPHRSLAGAGAPAVPSGSPRTEPVATEPVTRGSNPSSGATSPTESQGAASATADKPAPAPEPESKSGAAQASPATPPASAAATTKQVPSTPLLGEAERQGPPQGATQLSAGPTAEMTPPSPRPSVEPVTGSKTSPLPTVPSTPSPTRPALSNGDGPPGNAAPARSGELASPSESGGAAAALPQGEPQPPARPITSRSRPDEEEVALWGFDPAAREAPEPDFLPEISPDSAVPEPESGPAIAVEATAAAASVVPAMVAAGIPGLRPRPKHGWSVRLSPKAAEEQDRRLRHRQAELPALVDEIIDQVHQQRRAVADRGQARQAVRSAAEQTVPSDLSSATTAMAELLEAKRLADAAALALRVTEAFPGEVAAELACRAGEACRQAKDVELAALCFTTAVLSAPPCEAACWQLAGMALEQRDARLAPIWMEFLARLLRLRGADEDAIVVYRQLLNLAPRRQDVRDVLRVASLTGTLPD